MQLDLFESPSEEPVPRSVPPTAVPARSPQNDLRNELERRSGMTVQLVVTDNSSTVLSVKHRQAGAVAALRVHHMFLDAPPPVVHALASWLTLRKNKRAAEIINEYIGQQKDAIRAKRRRTITIHTTGMVHDLCKLLDENNTKYFSGEITARITWGPFPAQSRRRSVTFGSYSHHDHLIRISKLLDFEFVPDFFVRFIVFHEMLHAHLGIDEYPSGRRCIHGRQFRALERAYPQYDRALAWQNKNLHRFLRSMPQIRRDCAES